MLQVNAFLKWNWQIKKSALKNKSPELAGFFLILVLEFLKSVEVFGEFWG